MQRVFENFDKVFGLLLIRAERIERLIEGEIVDGLLEILGDVEIAGLGDFLQQGKLSVIASHQLLPPLSASAGKRASSASRVSAYFFRISFA